MDWVAVSTGGGVLVAVRNCRLEIISFIVANYGTICLN
jgi:hypothetical protein